MEKALKTLNKLKELVASHEQKLYRFMYKEGILDDERDEELTEQEKFIIFQYKIFAILHKYLEEALEDESSRHLSTRNWIYNS